MSGRSALGESDGWALLARAPAVHVAGVRDGRPVLRTMHHVVHDGAVWLHGVPGSALNELAEGPVQIGAEEVVARIPSWMRDPQRACPATTYYRSVWLSGTLRKVDHAPTRAAVLQRMMEVLQPEGRHVPITHDHALYRSAVAGLGVWKVDPTSVSAVVKMGQDQRADHVAGILRGLWTRGEPGDHAAIEQISALHPEHPAFAELPAPFRARCHPSEADVAAAVALARGGTGTRRSRTTTSPRRSAARRRGSGWRRVASSSRPPARSRTAPSGAGSTTWWSRTRCSAAASARC
jgi:nitroimidazol reductase NimA-like FMN-containing flavoprotein (pyridoxamine 5'-phosphate oxidase superfamily)